MHVSKAVCGGQRYQVPLELVIGSKPSMDAVFPVDAGYRTQALCTSSIHAQPLSYLPSP